MFERQAAGIYRNTAAIIDADGQLLGTYRKMHIPDDPLYNEKFYFTPGDTAQGSSGFKVWKTRYATIGVLICWDQWFPEAARITSLLGAEVLFYPTAIGWHPSEKEEWGATQVDNWRTVQRAHAISNGVYVASPNRIGHEDEPGTDGITFFGQSFIADPSGRLIASAGEEETVLVGTCDPAEIESARRHWPFLRDRRTDAYGPILQRHLGE
jgi:N-carbamoylputrescine amidase